MSALEQLQLAAFVHIVCVGKGDDINPPKARLLDFALYQFIVRSISLVKLVRILDASKYGLSASQEQGVLRRRLWAR